MRGWQNALEEYLVLVTLGIHPTFCRAPPSVGPQFRPHPLQRDAVQFCQGPPHLRRGSRNSELRVNDNDNLRVVEADVIGFDKYNEQELRTYHVRTWRLFRGLTWRVPSQY